MVKDTDKGIATWVCGYVHLKSATTPDDQVYDMLNALSDVGSGQYIIENWGYAHSNAAAYDAVDAETLAAYGFDDVQKFFEGSLFLMRLNPQLNPKCCASLNVSNPVSKTSVMV